LDKTGQRILTEGNDIFRNRDTADSIIAAVNGMHMGGGCELAWPATFASLQKMRSLVSRKTGLGITPGFGGTQRLARLIGAGMAKQMIFTARNIKADEALRIGLGQQRLYQQIS